MYKRIVFTLAGAAALVLLSLLGPSLLSGWRQGPTPVSAAEVLERANATLASQASGADVIYDRLLLGWQGLSTQRDVVAELWQSSDGTQFRYQLTNAEGDLLYFVQRDGERLWRSNHVQPIGDATVTRIYETSLEQYQAESASEPSPWGLLYSDLSVSWAAMDRLIVQRQQACSDLYCLLLGPELSWECDEQGCTPNGAGAPIVQARLNGEEQLDDGRTVYIVELALAGDWTRTLRVDKQSFALLEIVERERDNFIASLQHQERQALSSAQSSELFGAIPHNLEVVPLNQADEREDRLWIISVSPEPGTELQSQTEFEVIVGYELASAPEAMLQVNLIRPDFESNIGDRVPMIRGTDFVNIQASNEQITLHFTIRLGEEQWLAPGDVALEVMMSVWEGANHLDVLAYETFVEYQWYKP